MTVRDKNAHPIELTGVKGYRSVMEKKRRKEEIARAITKATTAGVSLKKISEETLIPYGSLRNFVSSHLMSMQRLAIVATWLENNDFLPAPQVSQHGGVNDYNVLLATELHSLADSLMSPSLPQAAKYDLFRERIAGYYNRLKAYEEALNKPKE